MSDLTEPELHEQLRAWACGYYPTEAATELLIRAGFARPGAPWVQHDEPRTFWIDFAAIAHHVDALSSGEQRVLLFAASLSGDRDTPAVRLGDLVSVDERLLSLMSAALEHAGGLRSSWGAGLTRAGGRA